MIDIFMCENGRNIIIAVVIVEILFELSSVKCNNNNNNKVIFEKEKVILGAVMAATFSMSEIILSLYGFKYLYLETNY